MPDLDDLQVTERLAKYFNRVSNEFEPLQPEQIPVPQKTSGIPQLREHEVARRIKSFRKPKSMVPGDVFPALVTKFSDFFAITLSLKYTMRYQEHISRRPNGRKIMLRLY